MSLAWAWKVSSARKRTGSLSRKLYRAGPKVRVDREAVRRLLEAQPDLYLRELQAALRASTGTEVSTPHLCRDQQGAWISAQKKSFHASERDSEAYRKRRRTFIEQLRRIAPDRLIYLDESGVSTQMTKRYARAPHGRRDP